MYRAEPPRLGGGSGGSPPRAPSSCKARAKPKSQIRRCWPSASRTRFVDFKSKWAITGRCMCKYRTPSRSSAASWKRSAKEKRRRRTCKAWCKFPPGANSVTRTTRVGSKHAPTNSTTRGWLSSERILISAMRSLAACSSYMQSFRSIIFATTSRWQLRSLPRLTVANSPRLTQAPSSTSPQRRTFSGARHSRRFCSCKATSVGMMMLSAAGASG
mmetsp:Transcript_141502/g.394307  ORF Transcript_141502/g.394307 Transcript_141502/m.394307 type:complete len:215 (-) Transcript_141502:252-896(-)